MKGGKKSSVVSHESSVDGKPPGSGRLSGGESSDLESPGVRLHAPAELGRDGGIGGAETRGIWEALREVMDPELPVSLVDLGLIYAVRWEEGQVEIELTYTATGCPCTVFIHEDIRERLKQEPGVERVTIHEVWDPPWTKSRISASGREALRRAGVVV